MRIMKTDVVIVGGGLAGLYTALSIDEKYDVLILSKGGEDTAGSKFAQGGIAACIGMDDSFDRHVSDTLVAGNYYNDPSLVENFVADGAKEVFRLMDYGVEFDRGPHGEILRTLEGGHSKHRVLHAHGDATGREIMVKISAAVHSQKHITWKRNTQIIELLKVDYKVCGLEVIIQDEVCRIICKKVVLATGGIGGQYLETTNPEPLFGEGIAFAYEAGARIKDASLVQFHPTALYLKDSKKRFLMTEAIRGEGGVLRNSSGKAFMSKYDKRKDLAPRDVVARAVFSEMKKTNADHVWLDIRHHSKEFLEERFPTVFTRLREEGICMEKDMIPVLPVAHYFVGGIEVDYHGATNIDNLYACGETASTGIHGGNRLASNSLLECIVYGKRCGNHINKALDQELEEAGPASLKDSPSKVKGSGYDYDDHDKTGDKKPRASHISGQDNLEDIKHELKELMTDYVGIVRSDEGLNHALRRIKSIEKQLLWKRRSIYWLETYRRVITARLIVEDGITKDSIGCHYKKNNRINEVAM